MTFYGVFCSLALSIAAVLVIPGLVIVGGLAPMDSTRIGYHFRLAVGLALAAAASVAFLSDVSHMLVRAANRDANARMFAWATKRFLLVIVGTVLLSALAFL